MSERTTKARLRGLLGGGTPSADRPAPQPAPLPPGQRQRVIAILGMHRSGTSSLAGSLEEAGLYLGDVGTSATFNQKGHREPQELNALHEAVLITSGGAWHIPPEQVTWSTRHKKKRDDFIASRAGLALWGFKDPRTVLVLDGWLEAIPDLELVATFRHPAVVARSLQRRHGGETPDMWLQLWLDYNTRLLELLEPGHVPVIDFDLPGERYRVRLEDLMAELDLHAPEDGEFFDATLRTSQQGAIEDVVLPDEVERAYRQLVEIAAGQAAAGTDAQRHGG